MSCYKLKDFSYSNLFLTHILVDTSLECLPKRNVWVLLYLATMFHLLFEMMLLILLFERHTPLHGTAWAVSGSGWNTDSINQCPQQLHLTSPCPPGLSPPTVCEDSPCLPPHSLSHSRQSHPPLPAGIIQIPLHKFRFLTAHLSDVWYFMSHRCRHRSSLGASFETHMLFCVFIVLTVLYFPRQLRLMSYFWKTYLYCWFDSMTDVSSYSWCTPYRIYVMYE